MLSYKNPVSSRRMRRIRAQKLTGRMPNLEFLTSASAIKYAVFGFIGLTLLGILFFFWVSRDLPSPGEIASPDLKDSTRILDKNDNLLFSVYEDYNRIYVPIDQIPDSLEKATIAIEEKDFYSNKGYSVNGYLRVIKDVIIHQRLTGGSTITQQLVKNVLLSSERSVTRKAKELILAVQVEKRFTKDEILEMYLNNVPYGGSAVGVEAASNLYFAKHAKDLTFSEAAFLAGLPQAPSYYSPYAGNGKAYVDRAEAVLKRMVQDGYISKKQRDKALSEINAFAFSKREGTIKAPHFVMYVRQKLVDLFGEDRVENGNLTVKTTLDYDMQKEAEKILYDELERIKDYRVGNGSMVVLDAKTGAILSMVGSKDYFDTDNSGNFNAVLAKRQPGSSLKPIVYATGLEKGYTASTLFMDIQTEFPTYDEDDSIYKPVNYDGKYRGPVQMRFALANSLNIPAVKMLAKIGIKPVMQKAYEMGIQDWEPTSKNLDSVGYSLVLGGRETALLDIATAYSVFANEGKKSEPFSIVEVKDPKGKTLYKHKDEDPKQVLSPEVAFIISHILLDNNAREMVFGLNSFLKVPGKTVAAKTGTTDQKRDNWIIGYTPSFVVGVWIGNNDNKPMNPNISSGATGASPIWNKMMKYILKDKKDEQFHEPDSVQAMEIDALGGGLVVDGQPKRSEYFAKGTEPTTIASIYKTLKMSKHDQGKLASDQEVSRNDYDLGDYVVFEEEDPASNDGENRWQKGINEWLKDQYRDQPKYHPPTEKSGYSYSEEEKKEETPTPTLTPTPTP